MSKSDTDKLKENLIGLSTTVTTLVNEYERLKLFEQAMLEEQPYKVGDSVVLSPAVRDIDFEKAYGWAHNKGIFQPLNSGTVENVFWNQYSDAWQVAFKFDLEWSQSSWSGNQTHIYIKHPDNRHVFMLGYKYLWHKGSGSGEPILPPPNAANYMLTGVPKDKGPIGTRDMTYAEVIEMFGPKRKAQASESI